MVTVTHTNESKKCLRDAPDALRGAAGAESADYCTCSCSNKEMSKCASVSMRYLWDSRYPCAGFNRVNVVHRVTHLYCSLRESQQPTTRFWHVVFGRKIGCSLKVAKHLKDAWRCDNRWVGCNEEFVWRATKDSSARCLIQTWNSWGSAADNLISNAKVQEGLGTMTRIQMLHSVSGFKTSSGKFFRDI